MAGIKRDLKEKIIIRPIHVLCFNAGNETGPRGRLGNTHGRRFRTTSENQ